MGIRDLPDMHAQAQGCRYIYQANPLCPCYKRYIPLQALEKSEGNCSAVIYENVMVRVILTFL